MLPLLTQLCPFNQATRNEVLACLFGLLIAILAATNISNLVARYPRLALTNVFRFSSGLAVRQLPSHMSLCCWA